nr:GntR family transcriptional regulator [Cupriavidus basilensis]
MGRGQRGGCLGEHGQLGDGPCHADRESLETAIQAGTLRPGAQLVERALADEFESARPGAGGPAESGGAAR